MAKAALAGQVAEWRNWMIGNRVCIAAAGWTTRRSYWMFAVMELGRCGSRWSQVAVGEREVAGCYFERHVVEPCIRAELGELQILADFQPS